jgi:hypothetical protein
VAETAALHADLQLFLANWYRAWLATRTEPFLQGFRVDVVEPSTGTFPARLLVIGDDGGTPTSLVTCEHSIRLGILAGTKTNPKDANDAARYIWAARHQIPSGDPANPIAAILGGTAPVPVAEAQDRARRYANLVLSDVATRL